MENVSIDTNQQQEQAEQKRVFDQQELNRIVKKASDEAVERYARQHQSQAQQQAYQPQGMSEADVRRLASEQMARDRDAWIKESQERADAEAAERIVNSYRNKIAAGKDKYEDFDKVTNSVDMRYYPNVVQLLAEHAENAADILYDLAQNRSKLHQLETQSERNPRDALYEMQRLAESIKANDSVAQRKVPNTPLTQQRPSSTGTSAGDAKLSMRDLKRMYKA